MANISTILRRALLRRQPRAPRGLFRLLQRSTSLADFRVVLDVGANVGNTTAQYLQYFPDARVWAFEPVSATCNTLRARFAHEPRVTVRQEALGSTPATAPMLVTRSSVMNTIVEHMVHPAGRYEQVKVTTGDAFLAEAGLATVDFMKVDTEGHDLKVLMGFAGALQRKAIRFLQVEAGMNSTNVRHVPIQRFLEYLEPQGYHLFRIIGQMPEWGHNRGILRRADLVFWRGR